MRQLLTTTWKSATALAASVVDLGDVRGGEDTVQTKCEDGTLTAELCAQVAAILATGVAALQVESAMPPGRVFLHFFLSLLETTGRRLVGRGRRKAWPFTFEVAVGLLRRNFLYCARLPVPEARSFNERLAGAVPFRHAVERIRETMGGVAVVRFVPRGASPRRRLVYLHGGSYLMGSSTTHADLIARLALTGFEVIAVEYRLAPEHSIADAVADVCAVFAALEASGWDRSSVVLAGDSAGGGLAYLAAIALRDAGRPLPAAIATIAPWTDLACPGPSMEMNERWDWGTAEALRGQGRVAAGASALDDPRISPARAELRGLPPTLIHAGEAEIVRDPVLAFADALRAAGVETEVVVWPDMVHDFHLLADQHPLAREATEKLAAFLHARCSDRAA
jgi:epsilon-lactone hydrolase